MAQLPEQKDFYWINKDLGSSQLSRSQGQEATSILRFVQQKTPHVRRHRRNPASKKHHDFVAFETARRPRLQPSTVGVRLNSYFPNSMRSMQSRWRLDVPSNNLTSGSAVDPFSSAVTPITAPVHALLQYTKTSLLSGAGGYKLEVFPEGLRPMVDMYRAAVQYAFQDMIRFEHIMYPMLAAFSRRLQRLNDNQSIANHDVDHYAAKATAAVRTSIAAHLDDKQLLSSIATGVHFLICASGLSGSFEETRLHINAFLKLLPYIDTKTTVGYWEVDLASSWDVMNSAAIGQAPTMRVATSDPGPMPAARMVAIKDHLNRLISSPGISNAADTKLRNYHARGLQSKFDLMRHPSEDLDLHLGSSLDEVANTNLLRSPITRTLQDLLDCLVVAKLVWRAPDLATKEDTEWLCKRSRAVLHSFLSMTEAKRIDTSTFAGRQAECVRLTLIIVLMSAQYRLTHISRRQQSLRLRAALMPIARLDWAKPHRAPSAERQGSGFNIHELLLWILLTGHWAATDTPEAAWFAETAVEVATQKLDLKDYDDLHLVMTRYLYSKTVQREALENVTALMHP